MTVKALAHGHQKVAQLGEGRGGGIQLVRILDGHSSAPPVAETMVTMAASNSSCECNCTVSTKQKAERKPRNKKKHEKNEIASIGKKQDLINQLEG